MTVILNPIFNVINSESYLATHHCYQSDKNVKWFDETFPWYISWI